MSKKTGDMMELQFDMPALKHITGNEMKYLIKMLDLDLVGETLAKYVTACPASWGDPKDPDTYLNLPLRGEGATLQGVIEAMAAAIKKGVQ